MIPMNYLKKVLKNYPKEKEFQDVEKIESGAGCILFHLINGNKLVYWTHYEVWEKHYPDSWKNNGRPVEILK